jgi:hypothetical protein
MNVAGKYQKSFRKSMMHKTLMCGVALLMMVNLHAQTGASPDP